MQLSDVTAGTGGFVLDGEAATTYAGFSVSGAGDVNGDGMDDIIVAAHRANPNGPDSGRSYVVFGKADTTAVQLSDITAGTGGFVLDGEAAGDLSGRSVRGAGDVNGDGMDDLVVGAPYSNPNGTNSGRSYVVFGKADTTAVQLSAVTAGTGGFVLDGEAAYDNSGYSVSRAGDVNGDGMDDLIVGAQFASPSGNESGRSYVVFGKADTTAVELSDITIGTGGFVIDGEVAEDRSGVSVSGAGDVNGDGMADLIIGAEYADPNGDRSGRSYVVFGKAGTTGVQLADIAGGTGGFVLDGEAAGDRSGRSVRGAGDVNGDGMDDLIVGAEYADFNGLSSGRSYVIFGKTDTTAVQLSDIAGGTGGYALDGEAASEFSGHSVSGAGDVNGDGVHDIIIGADRADPNGLNSGRSYVVFGVLTGEP